MAARFLKAVLSGTVAAAIGPLLLIGSAAAAPGWTSPDDLPLYVQISIALAISLVLVTAGAIAVGAPAAMALRRLRMEDGGVYVIVGAVGGSSFVFGLLALIGQTAYATLLPLAALSGAATGYTWELARPDGKGSGRSAVGRDPFVGSLRRASMTNVTRPLRLPVTIPVGRICVPPIAFVIALCVIALSIIVGAAAEGRLDWLPRQEYFPPLYRTTQVQCVSEPSTQASRPTLMVDRIEDEWYQQHWRAAKEPSLYLASRSSNARETLTYRFSWLRSFSEPVFIRVDETPDGGLRLRAKQMSGNGGYSPGKLMKIVERRLTDEEAAKLRRTISETQLFEQPPIGCLDGADGSKWLIEANDHGRYRYLQRWSPQGGPVRQTGLMLLGFTGWTFGRIY